MIDRTSPIDLGRPALDIGKTRKSNFIGQNSSEFWSYFFFVRTQCSIVYGKIL